MKPELGKRARLRDGRVTEPIAENFIGSPYPYVASVNGERRSWDSDGRFSSACWPTCPADVVEVIP